MKTYTINSECGVMDIEANSVEEAKRIYYAKHHYDFDIAEYRYGSWYFICDEDGSILEAFNFVN